MQFKTYVQKNKPVYMYIHGECLSAFSFQEEIRELKKDYTLVIPILDGHGSEAHKPFISIQQCATELLAYIQDTYDGHIQVLSGFSLGAQIAVTMLSMKPDLCAYAMIESAMMQPVKLPRQRNARHRSSIFFIRNPSVLVYVYRTIGNSDCPLFMGLSVCIELISS